MQSEYCIRDTALGALGHSHRVTLVRGAHATYPDGEPAADIAQRVGAELADAGVDVIELADLAFGRRPSN